jgi:hypothetical protein
VIGENLLGPDPIHLPERPAVEKALAAGEEPKDVAKRFPASPLAWAVVAEAAHERGETLESYAFARVGYHRGLDMLRKAGWRGQGPIPWSHEPNRGVLRALYALRRSAEEIGEKSEVDRLTEFLNEADANAIAEIENS